MGERWWDIVHALFITHVYAEFFRNRVGKDRFILPKVACISDIHYLAFLDMNLRMLDLCLFSRNTIVLFCFYRAAFAATRNGKFRWPPLGCLDLPKNKTKQNKTKQNKTKQNKPTNQTNKTKGKELRIFVVGVQNHRFKFL